VDECIDVYAPLPATFVIFTLVGLTLGGFSALPGVTRLVIWTVLSHTHTVLAVINWMCLTMQSNVVVKSGIQPPTAV
jgi:hypothetical protein